MSSSQICCLTIIGQRSTSYRIGPKAGMYIQSACRDMIAMIDASVSAWSKPDIHSIPAGWMQPWHNINPLSTSTATLQSILNAHKWPLNLHKCPLHCMTSVQVRSPLVDFGCNMKYLTNCTVTHRHIGFGQKRHALPPLSHPYDSDENADVA